MPDLSQCNPTSRFSGLADLYARCRPSYPEAALSFVLSHCGLRTGSFVVDVGSGTGISSRLLAERGLRVLGIEPNADMRRRAEQEPTAASGTPPEYREGRAESTGLLESIADAVIAAQAFHWFVAPAALEEFHRILKPGSWAVLLWNERDETDLFTAAYGSVFRSDPKAAALEMMRGVAGEPLLVCPLFTRAQRVLFAHAQELDLEGMLGRALSASYAPREPQAAEAFATALTKAFHRHQRNGRIELRYQTSVYVGQRPHAGI